MVALREGWRECRRNGVRLALTDEEAEGMLQFDSSNSVCSYVVVYVHSARHPDNTNNNHQPKELQGAPQGALRPFSSVVFFSRMERTSATAYFKSRSKSVDLADKVS